MIVWAVHPGFGAVRTQGLEQCNQGLDQIYKKVFTLNPQYNISGVNNYVIQNGT